MRWRHRADRRLVLLLAMFGVACAVVFGAHSGSRAPRAVFPAGRLAAAGVLPDDQIRFYQTRLADHPREATSWNMLGVGYMRKLRESGDPVYALRAEQALRHALAVDPRDPNTAGLLAWVALTMHQFTEARVQAEALIRDAPGDHLAYAILGDADIELGRYSEAQAAFQHMMDFKPGPAAYTRAAYFRQLHGDIVGALAMMQRAVEGASPRDRENLAWTRVQLGHLYFGQGRLSEAEQQYREALRVFPGYLYGEAGMGDVQAARGRFGEAVRAYERSLAVVPLPQTAATLGDVYTRLGRAAEAERQYALVEYIGRLTELNQAVYNRDLALFFADHDRRLDQAVRLAEREASLRPDIYSTDALAWAYFKVGRNDAAARLMARALALGTRDATLFFHAGMVAWKRGDRAVAVRYLREALQTNPYFHVLHAPTARRLLVSLGE